MAVLTAKALIDKAALLLFDVPNIKWSRAELLGWLNTGQRLVVTLQPNSTNTISVMKLAAGSRQNIPVDGWLLLDILRNMGVTGTMPGRAIRVTSRRLLDTFNPNWNADKPTDVVIHYVYDPQDQTAFFVYPPSKGNGYIELNYSNVPADIVAETSVVSVPDAYENPLLDYMMFRANSKPGLGDGAAAQQYLAAFNGVLGGKLTAEQANDPNIGLAAHTPGAKGGTS